jgi:hypothetical protein
MKGFRDLIGVERRPKTPGEADALALRHLVSRGADLARPRHLVHFLYFDREDDARAAEASATEAGWGAELLAPREAITVWTVRADGTRVVNAKTVEAFRSSFERLAAEHGGEYDGWEASAKP